MPGLVTAILVLWWFANRRNSAGQPATAAAQNLDGRVGCVFLFVLPLAVGALVSLRSAPFAAVPSIVVTSLFLFPSWWCRHVFAPAGLPGFAGFTAAWSLILWRHEPEPGRRALATAWALSREQSPSERDRLRVEQLRDGLGNTPLDGAKLAALALTEVRSDIDSARRLMRAAAAFPPKAIAPRTRWLVQEWLAADALQQGDWRGALDLARDGRLPDEALARFVVSVARVFTADPAPPSALLLRLRWLLAGRRSETRPVMQAALAHLAAPPSDDPPPDPQSLLRGHVLASTRLGGPSDEEFRALLMGWSITLDDPEGEPPAVSALGPALAEELRTQVAGDLAALACTHGITLPDAEDDGGFLDDVRARAHQQLRDALELALAEAAASRGKRDLVRFAKAYAGVRDAWVRAVRVLGESFAALEHGTLDGAGNGFACELHTDRMQYRFACAVFTFLAEAAKTAGNEEAAAREGRNSLLFKG